MDQIIVVKVLNWSLSMFFDGLFIGLFIRSSYLKVNSPGLNGSSVDGSVDDFWGAGGFTRHRDGRGGLSTNGGPPDGCFINGKYKI